MRGKLGAVVIALILITGVICGFMCTERVPAGYVGVVFSMANGVEDTVLTQGFHLISPMKKVTLYSVATEQLYMSADKKEGSKDDDSFDVICKDGKMNVDFEMSYSFDADIVPDLYSRYRGLNGEDIVNSIIRGKIKTKISEVTSQYTVLEAHMEKKAELNKTITEYMRSELIKFGLVVESANLTRTSVDPTVETAIVQRSKVAQELEIEKQKQERARLEAETKVIEARGDAEKKLIEANNKAEVIKIEASAEAEANKKISGSINEELIKLREMEARDKHGWVTVQGSTAIVDNREE